MELLVMRLPEFFSRKRLLAVGALVGLLAKMPGLYVPLHVIDSTSVVFAMLAVV